ncbi:MAG: spore germination protein, partial [Clostridia bacterium]|nr:spore germination protein [Clostridia bacterium]
MAIIRQLYNLPLNQDIIIREFEVGTQPTIPAFAVMIDGLVNADLITQLLESLIVFSKGAAPRKKVSEYILRDLFPGQQTSLVQNFQQVLDAINFGDTVFFFEHSRQAVVVDSKGFKSRGVEKPSNEQLIMGPHEAFNEVLRVNTGLLRRIMRTKDLITEYLKVGERISNDVVLVYLNNLVNPQLLQEVRNRLKSLRVDFISDSGMLEELIIERPFNLFPQTLSTERPDKVASCLLEGKVGILVGGSPNALIVPTTIFDQLHTGEESYLRWQYGSFIRWVRMLAFLISFLLPGLYVAIMLYHQEMLPTELLMAVAANREQVPFPTIVEILLMEVSFELVREAGIRVPGLIGPTIGIIGGLILGQASVEANLVSPILVVLVAVTGLASF